MEQISLFKSDSEHVDPLYYELSSINLNETRIIAQLGIKVVVNRYVVATKKDKKEVYVLETKDEHEIYYSLDDIYYRMIKL